MKMIAKALEQMVNFFYGYDIDKSLTLDIVKELIIYSRAAKELLEDDLTVENVFDILVFLKNHRTIIKFTKTSYLYIYYRVVVTDEGGPLVVGRNVAIVTRGRERGTRLEHREAAV